MFVYFELDWFSVIYQTLLIPVVDGWIWMDYLASVLDLGVVGVCHCKEASTHPADQKMANQLHRSLHLVKSGYKVSLMAKAAPLMMSARIRTPLIKHIRSISCSFSHLVDILLADRLLV